MSTSPGGRPAPDLAERFRQRRSPLAAVSTDAPMLSTQQPWGLAVVHTSDPPAGADATLPLGPARWLAVHDQPRDDASPLVDVHGGPAVAVDVSHGMTRIRVAGAEARAVLAAGIALDLHPDAFPPHATATTAYRDVFVVLHAIGDDTYDLYVMRSFAATLWAWLADAAAGVA